MRFVKPTAGTLICTDRTSDAYIEVNNVGRHVTAGTDMHTIRPHGRSDYHILYIWKGETHVWHGKHMHILKDGMMTLYRPREAQRYTHLGNPQTEVFWLHFSGTGAEELVGKAGFSQEKILEAGVSGEARETLMRMIREIQLRPEGYEMYTAGLLMTFLASAARMTVRKESEESARRHEQIGLVVDLMHERFRENFTVGQLAAMCSLSEYHFIHCFKEFTGQSPHAYHISLRIEKAKELMSMTTMSISEAAFAVGYANPLYFSRLFRQYTGLSPTQFRASRQEGAQE